MHVRFSLFVLLQTKSGKKAVVCAKCFIQFKRHRFCIRGVHIVQYTTHTQELNQRLINKDLTLQQMYVIIAVVPWFQKSV